MPNSHVIPERAESGTSVVNWRDSTSLYDAFAPEWDACFESDNHRNAYDLLAWEYVSRFLPAAPAVIVDVGCGTGRWVGRFLSLGHRVIGIEQSPEMIKVLTTKNYGSNLTLVADSMERIHLAPACADLVVAMGSVQYARDPALMIRRFASWTKPGGRVFVCVDSLVALTLELLSLHKTDEALRVLESARGVFTLHGWEADLHLFDWRTLESYFDAAGLADLDCRGLLITMTALGRERSTQMIKSDRPGFLDLEKKLSRYSAVADAGKHIMVCGRRPL